MATTGGARRRSASGSGWEAATTPNRTAHSEEALKTATGSADKKRPGSIGGSGSPHQLTNCSWCGSKIEFSPRCYHIESPSKGLSFTHISLLTEVLTVINIAAIFHNTVHLFELSTEPNENTIIV